MTTPTLRCSAIAVSLLASTATGQDTLYSYTGHGPGDYFGNSVSGAGDVNGDGFADFIIAAFRDDDNGPISGTVQVFSGATGLVMTTLHGDAAGDEFGFSVSGAGDVDGDGFDDVIVGAPFSNVAGTNSGRARVVSGATGLTLHDLHGDSVGELFGWCVAGAGDVNSDGFDDVVVGAPRDGSNGAASGSASVVSGATGLRLFTIDGDAAFDQLGYSVSGAGDVNADGFYDVVLGAPFRDDAGVDRGSLRVVSGATGLSLFAVNGLAPLDEFGRAVGGAGDVDGDGFDDVIGGAAPGGYALVVSGALGAPLVTLSGDPAGDRFGVSVAGAGDVNGDGFADVIVGADENRTAGPRAGRATVFSGATWQSLFAIDGASNFVRLGASVAGAGDVNGDGYDDVITGAPDAAINGFNSGSALVVAGSDVVGDVYCDSIANSSGSVADITGNGSAILANNDLVITASDLPPNTTGYFLTSTTQDQVASPGGSSGVLCLGGSVGRYVGPGQVMDSGAAGQFVLVIDSAAMPTPTGSVTALTGETWNFQAWYRDVISGLGIPTSNFTNGLAVTFF